MLDTPFRALFLLRKGLDSIEVIPLGGDPAGDAPLSGLLSGRSELLDFIRQVGFDSIVESYQVSDVPRTGFLNTFHLASSAESIVELLEKRRGPQVARSHRVLQLTHQTPPEQLSLSPHEAFQLGASTLSTASGLAGMAAWFRQPVLART